MPVYGIVHNKQHTLCGHLSRIQIISGLDSICTPIFWGHLEWKLRNKTCTEEFTLNTS